MFGFSCVVVKAYLTDRTPGTRIVNGVVSDPQSIHSGVPKGSILELLLFIVYTNDAPSIIKSCDIQLYADDTPLFFSSNSLAEIEFYFAVDLNSVIT